MAVSVSNLRTPSRIGQHLHDKGNTPDFHDLFSQKDLFSNTTYRFCLMGKTLRYPNSSRLPHPMVAH